MDPMSFSRVAPGGRRDDIIAAVIEQISASGSPDVAMAEVVRRSGAALKTIYRSFGSKERLLAEALLVWQHGVVERATSAPAAPEVRGRVAQYLERMLTEFARDRGMARLLVRNFSTSDADIAELLTAMQIDTDGMLVEFLDADAPTLTLAHALTTLGLTTLAFGLTDPAGVIRDMRAAALALGAPAPAAG